MERTTFSALFFIRRTRLNKHGQAPVELRITINGTRIDMANIPAYVVQVRPKSGRESGYEWQEYPTLDREFTVEMLSDNLQAKHQDLHIAEKTRKSLAITNDCKAFNCLSG